MSVIKLNGVYSAEEALEKSQLNWTVEEHELFTGNGVDVDTHKALVRNDNRKVVGIVGAKYEPVQNLSAFAFIDVLAEKYGAEYVYGGEVKGGRKTFIQASLKEAFEPVAGDVVQSNITILNSHDGSSSYRAFLTPIRLFCTNQLNNAIKSATASICIRHTSRVEDRIRDAFNVFKMGTEAFDLFKERAQYLAHKMVDRQMVNEFIDSLIPDTGHARSRNQRDKVTELFEYGKGNTGQTAWHLYNAATEWVDHERGKNSEQRLDSSLFGSGASIKGKAFQLALDV